MNKISILLCLIVAITSGLKAQDFYISGKVTDNRSIPLAGCTVVLHAGDTKEIYKGVSSNNEGDFRIDGIRKGSYLLSISFIGFGEYKKDLRIDKNINLGKIILQEEVQSLNELVITGKTVKRFSDKKEYKITAKDKENYSDALSAMEYLPRIKVVNQQLMLEGGKAVKILINGVPSAAIDLSTISPSNIDKIEYYTQPPVQYSNLGLGAVINIITKTKVTGGSFGVNTQNALTTGFGNDIINGRYNFGNTQIGLTYHISYRNYSKRILDEMMRYKPKDQYIEKDKKGHKSPYAYEDQTIELNLTNSKAKSYVFNTKLSLSSFDRRRTSTQDISFIKGELTAQKRAFSRDNDSYIKPVADIYYNKLFGQKHEITLNAVGTYFKTKYDYAYNEQSDKTEHFNTATNIRTDKYSLIGDFLYNLKLKQNQVFVGARYMYSHSKQEDLPKPNNITENELYCFSGVTGMLGNKISYNASIGLSNNHFNTLLDQSFDYTYFRPEVRLSYFIDESSECNLNYEINTNTPSIGQLTNNPYYKGQNYIFVGNTNLNPNNRHHISLSYFKGIKKFVINAETSFDHASKPIAPVFKTNNTDIIETFDNIDYSNMAKASLFLQWYPLNGNLLRLRIYSEVYHQQNKLDNEKWSYTDYMVAPSFKINYKKWSFETCFQSARTSLDGQIKREVSSLFYSELSYRPIKNMNITAGLRYPFYDGTSTKYKTTGTNLISRTESELIKSNANMVYINFAYNFTFGKSKPNVKLKMNNQDNDSGVLNRDN